MNLNMKVLKQKGYNELKDLEKEYDKLQNKYGAKNLNSIYNGGWMF